MNRETLFRGKRTDNKEWIEGYYSEEIFSPLTCEIEHAPHIQATGTCETYNVDPNTTGEFTGLYDKNDRKIFEGDILAWGFGLYVEVAYLVKYARFAGVNGDSIFPLEDTAPENRCEVVGNVYDNPELLK